MSQHRWTIEDHIIALYLYRFGMESLGDPMKLLNLLEIPLSSMTMKFANLISTIYGKDIGKFRSSDMDKEVVNDYLNLPQENYRKQVFDIIYKKKE